MVDTVEEARNRIARLLDDIGLARTISTAARARAIELFGRDPIQAQWRAFFDSL